MGKLEELIGNIQPKTFEIYRNKMVALAKQIMRKRNKTDKEKASKTFIGNTQTTERNQHKHSKILEDKSSIYRYVISESVFM